MAFYRTVVAHVPLDTNLCFQTDLDCGMPTFVNSSVACRGTGPVQVQCGVKLWGHPGTRSPLVNWYLHEVGCTFEEYLPNHPDNPHPFGQVPALADDGGVEIFESGAILLYLSDK